MGMERTVSLKTTFWKSWFCLGINLIFTGSLEFNSRPVRQQQQDHCIVYYILYFGWFQCAGTCTGLGLVSVSKRSGVGQDLVLVWVVLTTTMTLCNLKQKYFGNIIVTMSSNVLPFIHTLPLQPVCYQKNIPWRRILLVKCGNGCRGCVSEFVFSLTSDSCQHSTETQLLSVIHSCLFFSPSHLHVHEVSTLSMKQSNKRKWTLQYITMDFSTSAACLTSENRMNGI